MWGISLRLLQQSTRQIWPWSTAWSRAKADRVLPREHSGHSKHPLPKTQEKTTHGHQQMVNTEIRLIIFFAAKDGEALYSQQKQDQEPNCGSDHELLVAKFRLKLKKVGKTTRPFRYDLNQIPNDYTVEVRNRFKGQSAWWTVDGGSWHFTGDRDQDHPHGKEMQKGKMVVWGGLTNSCEKKRSKKQRRKGKIFPFECRVPKNSKER